MSAEVLKTKLTEAQKAFDSGDYSAAEAALQSLDPKDPKVQLNLAVVRYLKGDMTAEAALAVLKGGDDGWRHSASAVVLRYEGHEAMLYNQALLEARTGRPAEAIRLLRNLLEASADMSVLARVRCLCLYQTLTQSAASLGGHTRSHLEDSLVQNVLSSVVDAVKDDAALQRTVGAAFADSSSLREFFSDCKSNPLEHGTYLNNLGLFFLSEGKSGVGSLCLAQAQARLEKQVSLTARAVTYNAGLSALLREEYDDAIGYFLDVQEHMQTSPLFWVRFSEAAVSAVQQEHRLRRTRTHDHAQENISATLTAKHLVRNFELLQLPGAVCPLGPLVRNDDGGSKMAVMAKLAVAALQNALFLLLPPGATLATCLENNSAQTAPLVQHALLYWAALELFRDNFLMTVQIGDALLQASRCSLSDRASQHPLPANLHAALLSYVTEALIQLNDPERALAVLSRSSLSSLLRSSVPHDHTDAAQRSRVVTVLVNLAITHIMTGSWQQANNILQSLLAKISETETPGSLEYRPERDAIFAYQILSVFVELAQGNKEKALEVMNKQLVWSV